ncbi:MAG: hypothetical protein ACYC6A_09095 [Armatimonadota bacterium]
MANEQTVTITDFSPGLLTNPDAKALPPGGAQVCRDVDTDRGDLRVRAGRVPAVRCPLGAEAGVRALQEFYVAGHDPEFRFVGVIADRVCWSVDSGSAAPWQAGETVGAYTVRRPTAANGHVYHCSTSGVTGGTEPNWPTEAGSTIPDGSAVWMCDDDETFAEIDAAVTVSASHAVRLAQFGDKLYLVDGVNLVRQLDADGHFTALESFDSPDVAPEITRDTKDFPVDAADGGVCRVESNLNPRGSGDTMVRAGTEAQGFWYCEKGEGGTPHWNDGYRRDTMWRTIEWDSFPHSSYVRAFTARAITSQRYTPSTDPAPAACLCLDITSWSSAADPLQCGHIGILRKHDVVVDLSHATAIIFAFYIKAGATVSLPDKMEIFWSEETTCANRDSWTYLDIPLTGAVAGEWNDVTVDISHIPNEQKNAIRWFGVRFGGANGLQLSATTRFEPEECWPYNPNGAQIIFSPFLANISKSAFVQGEYTFTYTYLRTIDGTEEESPEYIDATDLAHPYPIVQLNAAIPESLKVICTRDADSEATGVNVYARGGASAEFRRIGQESFDGQTVVRVPWSGDYAIDAPYLPEYIGTPPAGATMLCTFRNRMVYVAGLPMAKWQAGVSYKMGDLIRPHGVNGYEFCCITPGTSGDSVPAWVLAPGQPTTDETVVWRCQEPGPRDVLYFSNYGDPTRVPIMPSALQQVPATYGGWADLERWGHDVTGIAPFGPMLIAMKRQGIWACQGDPGDNSFRIDELDRREGCLSPESLAQVEGKLIWQARDKILALEGTTITDISQPIAPTVQAYSTARQAGAFGIYDPQTRRYLLVYPDDHSELQTEPGAEALVLQLKTSSWTQYTAQPGGCGLYTQHAAAPGIYLADVYGAGGAGLLFRLAPGVTTDACNDGTTAPIAWRWISGELPSPFPGHYTQISSVRGHVLVANPAGTYTLDARLYPNNHRDAQQPDACGYARTLTLTRLTQHGALGSGIAQWTPPPRGEIESFALKLERKDSDLVAVRSVSISCLPRLVVRGRQAARA